MPLPIVPSSQSLRAAQGPAPRLFSSKLVPSPRSRLAAPLAAGTTSLAASRIVDAIPSLKARDEGLLSSHGITSIEDLESIHFDLHLADGQRTRQFLTDVVGINNDGAVRGVLEFLGADEAHLAPYSKAPETPRHADALLLDASAPPSPPPQGTSSRPLSTIPPRTPRGMVSAAPTRSTPPLPARPSSRVSPAPMMPSRNPQPAASRSYGGVTATAPARLQEDGSLEELARFETQVLDLLQNYSGLTLERLDGLLYMSGKEPKYTQGIARLQLLLDAMESQGTIRYEDGVYRFQKRTPEPERHGSPTSSRNGANGGARAGSMGRSPASRSPGARAPAPRVYAEPLDLSGYEGRVLDVLRKYEGLPLERLNNMLSMSPGEPRYEASPEQLEPYLASLAAQGKILMDRNVYKYNSFYSNRGSRSASPSAARRQPTPTPAMGDMGTYSHAVMDLIQNYAGLTLERLDNLLTSSPKAVGYRNSPRQLSQLLDRLVAEGRITEQDGVYQYRPQSPAMARSKSPTASRGLPPAPTVSRRKTSSPTPAPRMADIAFYEPAVLDLLQSYAGLTLERLDGLLTASPRAPGYIKSPVSLQGLLTTLQAQGRVTNDNGVYRYRTTGKTPVASRARSPVVPASRPASPMGAGAVDAMRRALSQGLSSVSAPRTPSPVGSNASSAEDWTVYENTVISMLTNYGALPMDRLHDMLKMSMVWPRYDRSPAQLSNFLASLVAAGRLVQDNGLYRLAGTAAPARSAGLPWSSPPSSVTRYEGQVLSTLAAYPGLTVERLSNMLKLSKSQAGEMDEDSLTSLISSLVSQGKVTVENGLYKVTGTAGMAPAALAAPAASRSPTPLPTINTGVAMPTVLSMEQTQLLERLGFPTQDGITGFVPFAEIWNGRWAMLGIAASIPVEVRTGAGTLEQLGFLGLPSMELYDVFLWGAVALLGLGSVVSAGRWASGNMDAREKQRYQRLVNREPQVLEQPDRFYTDELAYARKAEITNGRAAMVGFLASILMEALTGRGIVGQAALYLKLMGILGDDSGF